MAQEKMAQPIKGKPTFIKSIQLLIPGLLFTSLFANLGLKYYSLGGVWIMAAYASAVWVGVGMIFVVFGIRRFRAFYNSLPDDVVEPVKE